MFFLLRSLSNEGGMETEGVNEQKEAESVNELHAWLSEKERATPLKKVKCDQ